MGSFDTNLPFDGVPFEFGGGLILSGTHKLRIVQFSLVQGLLEEVFGTIHDSTGLVEPLPVATSTSSMARTSTFEATLLVDEFHALD